MQNILKKTLKNRVKSKFSLEIFNEVKLMIISELKNGKRFLYNRICE